MYVHTHTHICMQRRYLGILFYGSYSKALGSHICVWVCVCVHTYTYYMYMYIYICMYVYISIYIYIYIYMQRRFLGILFYGSHSKALGSQSAQVQADVQGPRG